MPNIEYLKEKDGLPSFIPARSSATVSPTILGEDGVFVYHSPSSPDFLFATEEPRQTDTLTQTPPGAVDPFRFMDFRVSYADGIVSIRAGRVHALRWSPPIDDYIPGSYVIPADDLYLPLEEGDEGAFVYLSLPWREHGGQHFGPGLGVEYPPVLSGEYYTHSFWSGFDVSDYHRRVALPEGDTKFAWAFLRTLPPGFIGSDTQILLARIGWSSGVTHHHFGSVFPSHGFDVLRTNLP